MGGVLYIMVYIGDIIKPSIEHIALLLTTGETILLSLLSAIILIVILVSPIILRKINKKGEKK